MRTGRPGSLFLSSELCALSSVARPVLNSELCALSSVYAPCTLYPAELL